MVEPPFPFPLPPDAILLAAEESYRTWPTGHGLVREKVPGQVFFSFLSKAPPTEVMAFYRRAMEAAGAKTRGDTRLVVTFARTPDWAPRALKAMAVEEADLYVSEGFSVRTGPNATLFPAVTRAGADQVAAECPI